MKKIKRLADIKQEKMRLRIRQLELEKDIKGNWKNLQKDLKPGKILKQKVEEAGGEYDDKASVWSAAIDYGAAWISHKLAAKAGQATEERVQQSMENVVEKIKKAFNRKKDQ
jgi:hypothetical protein